jgi:hypothetical protein
MTGFRVTKYDPRFRRPDGTYSRKEWDDIADIGRSFDGRVFELAEYLRVEDCYVRSVAAFMKAVGLKKLRVVDLETYPPPKRSSRPPRIAEENLIHVGSVKEGLEVSGDDLDWVVRLVLRSALWCRLEGAGGFYVHFSWDYYMYIGSDAMTKPPKGIPDGIFVEEWESPCHRKPE